MVAPSASWMQIGELSRRVGVSTDLLRKWERRYGVLQPGRTVGNQRLYSRVDEARLRLMLEHVRSGVPPAQAAELATAAQFRLKAGSSPTSMAEHAARARERMLEALARYDETVADRVLEKLLVGVAPLTVMREVFLPLLREVGERWAQGRLNVAQEHFASGFVEARLLGLARGWDHGLGPRALLACAPREQHTLGLLAFGIALHHVGWRITYLGADTPIATLAQAAASVRPRLTVLAAVMPLVLDSVQDDIRSLNRRWPVAVAGAGIPKGWPDRCGLIHLTADPVSAAESILE
ncbi:MAG: MerR family transcriptional regulator [Solirubrobacteraceae bacterium]